MPDLTQITSPSGVKFTVAKDAADAFGGFLADLEGAGYKIDAKSSGGYNPRNIAGTDTPSQHSFGHAIDINPASNARGAKTTSDLPANVNDLAAAHGLTWGGTWSGDTRDPMHFELSGKPAVADTGPSADDLQKRMDRLAPAAGTGGGAAAGATPAPAQGEGPSGDDLLRRMEGLAPAAAATPPPGPTPRFDDYGRPIGPDTPDVAAGQAIGESYRAAGSLHNWLAPAPDTEYGDVLPLARDTKTGEIRMAMPNMLRTPLYGATEPIAEAATLNPVTGTFGVTPEVSAAAQAFGARPTGFSRPLSSVPLAEREAAAAGKPPPGAPAPAPGGAPGQPQPAGAMVTPPQLATFTPEETAAYRASAEGRKLMENSEIGVPDRNAYISGVTVSAAEQELTAELARELKSAGGEDTAVSQDIKATAQRNDELRRGHLKDTTGDEVSVHNEEQAQKTAIEEAKPRVFGEDNVRGDVSMRPLLEQIDKTLAIPENRQNPQLQKVLGDLRDRLTNPDGTPKEMHPQEAWGLRRSIDRLTDKRMAAEDPNLHYEGHQLRTISDVLDGEIEKMAPGYADMVNTYRSHAQKIEAMQVLQDKTRGMLSQTTTPVRFSDFQRFMKNVVDMRKTPSTDLNPYKSITDEQMQRLWNVRDDLRRVATASELARAPGSDTLPNVMDMLKRHGPGWAAHGVANYISPGWGSVVVKALQGAAEPARAARAQARTRARAQELLHPPNPLINPNAPP
jgi:hypothetical protein